MTRLSLLVLSMFSTASAGAAPLRLGACDPSSFRVVTLNIWQLPLVARDRELRLSKLVESITANHPDLIALQEAWPVEAKRRIRAEAGARGYTHAFTREPANDGFRGTLGNGLMLLSRCPMAPAPGKALDFSNYTAPEEMLARKGALHARIRLAGGLELRVVNTHLGAVRFDDGEFFEYDLRERRRQLDELVAHFDPADRNAPLIVLGDFNLHTHRWVGAERKFSDQLGVDQELFGSLGFVDVRQAADPLWRMLPTYSDENAYAFGKDEPDQNLDAIFVRSGATANARPFSARRVFDRALAPEEVFLSDHFGIETDIAFEAP